MNKITPWITITAKRMTYKYLIIVEGIGKDGEPIEPIKEKVRHRERESTTNMLIQNMISKGWEMVGEPRRTIKPDFLGKTDELQEEVIHFRYIAKTAGVSQPAPSSEIHPFEALKILKKHGLVTDEEYNTILQRMN